ncbi:MAG: 4-hydroxybenzoate transporter [Rhodospirillales bacterium]|jgi:AAHS family 4-hydroxybenzoate transporter-like MFS transporter|nr:4-hydroxybenzoate transporter [Rhodospirillales bacterium]
MAAIQTIDITALIDDRKVDRFNAKLVVFCFFIILFDGYDIGAAAFAGPHLVKAWGVTSMAAMGPVFSASLFGILFGSPIFGWIGDRYGRTKAIVASCLTIGVFTLAAMWAHSLDELMYLRFFAGVGIGGMLPNVIALTAEYSPKRARATFVIIMFTGITLGGALPGPISNWLVPSYGWQVLFFIGGVFPIVMAIAAAFWLPESLKYLVLRGDRRPEVAKLVRILRPGVAVASDARFIISDEKTYGKFHPKLLFADGLLWITPLLWLLFICNQMAFYFTNSWLPTVLTGASVSPSHAAWATTLFQVGGTIGGLTLARPLDKMGLTPVCILFLLAIPFASLIGYSSSDETMLMVDVFLAGFTLLGLQFGLNATSAMIYPTAFRANGSGWAFAIGRCGSVAGPIVAGILISMHMPIQQLFLFLAIPLTIGTVASVVMARLYYARFHGMGLGRRETMDSVHV